MADPWDSAPIVEAPRPVAQKPRQAGAQASDSWDAAPTVESVLPDVSGRQGGLTPPGRRGAAAVPTAQEAAGGAYAPPQAAPAAPEPTARDKVVAAVEAGIEMLAQITGGGAGIVTGGLAGIARSVGAGQFGTPEGAQQAQESAAAGAQGGAQMVRQGLRMNPLTGPAVAALERAGGGLGERMSPGGQENVEAITGVINQFPAFQPAIGPVGGVAAAVAQPGGLRRSVGMVTDAVRRAPIEEPAPAGSVGAKAVDMPTQRRERAAALGVPLTKGDAERTFEQQRFEKETAKNPELGGPLRERKADQREAIYKRFDDWIDQTGAENLDANAVGKAVTDPIYEKAAKAKQEIRAAYEKADAAGETAELVPTDTLVRAINDADASKENAGVISAAERQLVRLGGALRGDDGMLIPGELSLAELNEVRKTIGVNGGKDATNAHFAGVLKAAVDASTEGRGGEAYQAARKLHSTYAAEFKNQGVIRDLIELKKGSTDRKTAMADVFQRSILSAKLEEVRAVKRTLTTAGDKGVQAWNDLRGKTVEWIRDEATKSAVRDERGNPVVSADKLGKAVDKLDRDGRLEEVFGKQAAQQLRDIADIARDVYTSPPDAVNTSNTASVLIGAIDTLVTYMASGGTVPLPAFTLLKKGIQNLKERKIKAKVRYALGPGEPIKESPTRAFEPEPPPAAGPGTPPAPKPPGNVPPAGGQGSLPGVEPAGGSVTRGTKAATKRERELTALRDQVTDPEVRRDIDAEITAERRRVADENRAAEYRAIARATTDPALRTKFEERAGKLAPEPPKPKAEPPEPIPVGEAVELDVHDATLDMVKATAEAEAAWRREHRLGDLDAERAKTTAQALQYDAAAVERAAQQFENSPRAFDREIQRIIDEGEARANQGEQGTGGGEGLGRPAEAAGEQAGARPQQPGPDGAAAAGAQRAPADGGGGSSGPTARQLKEAEASFLKNTEPTGNPITDAFSKKLRDDFDAAVEEYGTRPDAQQGRVLNTDTARELSPDYLKDRTRSADVHEPASAFIKRLYAKKLHEPTPEGRERVVMFSAGGTGAGKTSAINGMGDSAGRPEITYDTNMNALASAASKIDQALEAGRDVRIMYVYADPVDAFHQAMGRAMRQRGNFGSGRTVPIVEHVKTHVGARQVINQLRERYKDDLRVDFQGIDNSRGFGNARRESIENLPEVADNGLREKLKQIADEALAKGAIDEATHRGFTAQPEPASTLRHEGVGGSGGRGAERPGAQGRRPDAPVQEAVAAASADLGFVGSQTSVVTERGLRVPVQYRLADLGNLITSHDDALRPNPAFDANLQPRDRTRMGSEAQIARMENALQPELLAESPKASDGAPIVGPDGIVESGNARTIALRRAYAGGKAEGYRAFLEQNAARFGLKPEDVRAMRQPVLVRERTVEVDRADFARQANESPVSAMSDTEQAKSDAARMPDLEGLVTGDDGQINMTGSAEFIRQFMRYVVSPNEQNQLMTADGRLNQRGAIRIRNAIFSRAYNDPDMVAMMTESTDANVRNILAGMLRAAPDVARLRDLIDAGARSGRDFTPDMVEAVRRFSDAREQGMKVEQALAQGSLIGGEAPPEVARIMRALEADSRAPKRIADMIRGMVDEIDSGGDPRQSSLLGEPAADYNLQPQTAADLKARTEREARAAAAETAERKRLADKAKADAQLGDFTLTGSDRAADNPNQGSLFEKKPQAYNAPYETDLFGQPVPAPAAGGSRRAARGPAASPGNVQPAAEVPSAPHGRYATRAALVTTRQQKLGHVGTIKGLADAAHALAYLNKSAVERLDAIVTDAGGRPLAVIGGFKGALAQANVYPATLLGEALQIPRAARLWLVHNHPSGTAELSRADRALATNIAATFDGTKIEPAGILAVTGKRWTGANRRGQFLDDDSGDLSPHDGGPSVPAQERQLIEDGKLGPSVQSPSEAKDLVHEMVNYNAGRPTIVLLDAQHTPVAAVPWNVEDAMPLRDNGKLDALLRAVAQSNAGAALIGTGGGRAGTKFLTLEQAQNIGAALAKADVRVLDIIEPNGATAAEKGLNTTAAWLRAGPVAAVGLGAAAAASRQDDDQ